SYNGGTGGIVATATAQDRLARNERHVGLTAVQQRHERAASLERTQLASVNHGVPTFTATTRPATDAAALRSGGHREARIERGAQAQGAAKAGPARANRETRIERGPQGPGAVNAGPPRANREARIERGGPPPNAGGGQSMARVQNAPQPQNQPHPQGQPQPQGQPRGGEHQEKEKQK